MTVTETGGGAPGEDHPDDEPGELWDDVDVRRPAGADPTAVEGGSPNVVEAADDRPPFERKHWIVVGVASAATLLANLISQQAIPAVLLFALITAGLHQLYVRTEVFETPAPAVAIDCGLALVLIMAVHRASALINGTISGTIYGLLAMGLVLIYKSAGVFNFAQGEFGTVAAFAFWLLHNNDVAYVPAFVLALGAAAAMGLAVERVVIRPLFEAPRVTLLVATVGVSLLAIGIQLWIGGTEIRNVDPISQESQRIKLLGIFISDQLIITVLITLVVAVLLALFFARTGLGLAVVAASQEPIATELAGISVRRISALVWGLAAFLGGVAGVMFVPDPNLLTPGFVTSQVLIPAFTAAVIGGMTSLPGALIGGVIVGVGQAIGASGGVLPDSVPGGGSVATFALLIIILTVRPQGILGGKR